MENDNTGNAQNKAKKTNQREYVEFGRKDEYAAQVMMNLARQLTNAMKSAIPGKIREAENRDKSILLADLAKQLKEVEDKMLRELARIDKINGIYVQRPTKNSEGIWVKDSDGNYVLDENGNKIQAVDKNGNPMWTNPKMVRSNGLLQNAKEDVRRAENEWKSTLAAMKPLEKSARSYMLLQKSLNVDNIGTLDKMKIEQDLASLQEKYDKYQELLKKSKEKFEEVVKLRNIRDEYQRESDSFKKIEDENREFDRDSDLVSTNDNLGHYISTHWGGKRARLIKLMAVIKNSTTSSITDEIIKKFQDVFDERNAMILFHSMIAMLERKTNAEFFLNFEFTSLMKDLFIDNVLKAMPSNLVERFNPFYSILLDTWTSLKDDEKKKVIQKKLLDKDNEEVKNFDDFYHFDSTNSVEVSLDAEGRELKKVLLENIDVNEVAKTFNQWIIHHFGTACSQALKVMKEKRNNEVSEFEDSNNSDEDDERSKFDTRGAENEPFPFGRSGDFDDSKDVDNETLQVWNSLKTYLTHPKNLNDMALDATLSLRDNLPKMSYLKKLDEASAVQQVKEIYTNLLASANAEFINGRGIGTALEHLLLYSIGGAGNDDEFTITYNIIYTALQLYIYKFMMAKEKEIMEEEGESDRQLTRIEDLQEKVDDAQMKLNDPKLDEKIKFRASVSNDKKIKRRSYYYPQMDYKVDFLMNSTPHPDGSGVDHSQIQSIDRTY